MIAQVCDHESRRDSWFENRLVASCEPLIIMIDSCQSNLFIFCLIILVIFDTGNYRLIRPKKENSCVAFKWNFTQIGPVSRIIILFLIVVFFFKAPKNTKFGCFSTIPLKKHSIWTELGTFLTVFFSLFLKFLTRVGSWGQHNIIISWPKISINPSQS